MSSLIKCRKCNGPHVTIKCGKEKIEKVEKPISNYEYSKKTYIDKRKIVTVRISNLPEDITVDELTELVSEWGKIGRVNINTFESKSGFIDFHYISEAEYFVGAIDRTIFENLIISAEILKN